MDKEIIFVSFGTGGTLGHMSLISHIVNKITENYKITIMSEYSYTKVFSLKKKNIKWVSLKKQEHMNSSGGAIEHISIDSIKEYCRKNDVGFVIFSTFFDKNLVRWLRGKKIKSFLVSYPLRDAHTSLFFLRNYNSLFDKIIILEDLYNIEMPSYISRAKPVFKLDEEKAAEPSNNLLVTCGGGGRHSAFKYFEIVKKIVPVIRKLFPFLYITIIYGPNSPRLDFSDCKCIQYTKYMGRYIKQAKTVISEAGYFTTHELISLGKPGVLIPGNRRIDNQELRGIKYEKKKLGYCVMPEEKINFLVNKIEKLISDNSIYQVFQNNCKNYIDLFKAKPDISEIIMSELEK